MAKFILFLILLVPLVACGNWLLAHPGQITVDWLGYEVMLQPAFAALLVGIACVFIATIALVLWQIATWPDRRKARRRYRTLARGLRELTQGVTQLALGDEKRATLALKKAATLLPGEPLPQLLSAQLLQRQGQHEAARKELRALMKHDATAMLAGHRLIEQHLNRKEWAAALTLAEEMRKETPRDRWLTLTLIDLYARQKNHAQILAFTEGWQFQSPLSREERHRYAALGYLAQAESREEPRGKLTALRHAIGYAPDFLPAVLAYAERLVDDGETRSARKLLRQAWLKRPDPLLITPILRALAGETPRTQSRLLTAFLPAERSVLHYLLVARHALALDHPAEAEEALQKALGLEENRDACALMAEVEKRLHGNEAANRWMARAMNAPTAERWVCQACGATHESWQPHCIGCDTFDTLAHEKPQAHTTSVGLAHSS